MPKACIVCAAAADVYCHNDDAYLCFECDHTVHSAHPLAQTHRRTPIGELTGAEEDLDEGVVPQQLVPMNKAVRLGCEASVRVVSVDVQHVPVPPYRCIETKKGSL